jgi:fibro-slime domain-containing protein
MRVIHYDFPSDGSSNEFNMNPHHNGLITDIVQHKLTDFTTRDAAWFGRTSISKPTHYRESRSFSCGVGKWFREWTPDYYPYAYHRWDDCTTRRYDPAGDNWRNQKYYDSLEFVLDPTQGPNTYVFSRMGNYDTGDPKTSWRGDTALYFPLDRYGQDPPGSGHNYGFCTELHTTFVHQSGLKFEFTGDDDVWVFVNDSLVIDLGGIHIALNAILNLDDLENLEYGRIYNFDLFQCERHVWHSTSRMVTNIKMVPPKGSPSAQWRRNYSMNH